MGFHPGRGAYLRFTLFLFPLPFPPKIKTKTDQQCTSKDRAPVALRWEKVEEMAALQSALNTHGQVLTALSTSF